MSVGKLNYSKSICGRILIQFSGNVDSNNTFSFGDRE